MTSAASSWWRTDANRWSASGWSLELRDDELAEIGHDGKTLLRAVRATVRDRGWRTVAAQVVEVVAGEEVLVLRLRHEGLGARLDSRLSVHARTAALTITWDARNDSAFDTCRTGLVALHPASAAGTPVTVVHEDGTTEPAVFPTEISPHQPIRGIRELRVQGGPTLRFAGDVFEMEDQRNWSDASFKTYSRPLDLPYPYPLASGERVQQSITVLPGAATPAAAASTETAAAIDLCEAGAFPAIGVEASTAPDPVEPAAIGSFRVVELNLLTPNWRAALDRAALDGLPLDVRIVTDGNAHDLGALATALGGHEVIRLTAFDRISHITEAAALRALRLALDEEGVAIPLLAGARSHFTELNREQHRLPRDVQGFAVNTTPLFHAVDTEQLVEAIAMQRVIARQTVKIAAGLPVHIGPVSLRPRFNNVATTPEAAPTRTDLAEGYGAAFTGADDERQSARELAAWVVASAAALATDGIASLSWFETRGPRGICDRPAAEALSALTALGGTRLLTGDSPDGLLWALGSRGDEGDTILVANLGRTARRATVRMPGADPVTREIGSGSWVRYVRSRAVDSRITNSGSTV